jgi:long-chain acyl-CoA synthetase
MLERVRERIERQRGQGSFQRLTTQLARVKQLTGINVGPIVFRQLRDRLGGRLRFVASGGAAIRRSTVLGFLRLGIPLLQGYGLTEAGPVCAAQPYSPWRFRFSRHYERLAGSVGCALPGVELKLSPSRMMTKAGEDEGELIVRGPNVMAGYYADPDATREAIRDGWLHTGDLGRVDDSGWVWITGRARDIIVLDTGENVNPEEVESLIARRPLLADCCLLATGRHRRELRLIVHPNLDDAQIGADLTGDRRALQAACEEQAKELLTQLAPYKRPSRILIAPNPLPRTPLGKVKRHEIERLYS